ncbi:hypothetical protein HQ545_03095 [Candidatus Woesearchaeota archaeon]|nr:hypothetical protein [Candidatus Woesearchaeota archaeon]
MKIKIECNAGEDCKQIYTEILGYHDKSQLEEVLENIAPNTELITIDMGFFEGLKYQMMRAKNYLHPSHIAATAFFEMHQELIEGKSVLEIGSGFYIDPVIAEKCSQYTGIDRKYKKEDNKSLQKIARAFGNICLEQKIGQTGIRFSDDCQRVQYISGNFLDLKMTPDVVYENSIAYNHTRDVDKMRQFLEHGILITSEFPYMKYWENKIMMSDYLTEKSTSWVLTKIRNKPERLDFFKVLML